MAAILRFERFFKNAIYWYTSHRLTLAILLATFCAFEWRSNLKIDRVMVLLRFDLLLTS